MISRWVEPDHPCRLRVVSTVEEKKLQGIAMLRIDAEVHATVSWRRAQGESFVRVRSSITPAAVDFISHDSCMGMHFCVSGAEIASRASIVAGREHTESARLRRLRAGRYDLFDSLEQALAVDAAREILAGFLRDGVPLGLVR